MGFQWKIKGYCLFGDNISYRGWNRVLPLAIHSSRVKLGSIQPAKVMLLEQRVVEKRQFTMADLLPTEALCQFGVDEVESWMVWFLLNTPAVYQMLLPMIH